MNSIPSARILWRLRRLRPADGFDDFVKLVTLRFSIVLALGLTHSALAEPRSHPVFEMRREGITLSDGSSTYHFLKDGKFESYPIGLSGRVLTGTWTSPENGAGTAAQVIVVAEESWNNGQTGIGDHSRRIVFMIYAGAFAVAGASKEKGLGPALNEKYPREYRCYWFIDSLTKGGAGGPAAPAPAKPGP